MIKNKVTIGFFIFVLVVSGWFSVLYTEVCKDKWQWQVDDLIIPDRVREAQLSADGKKMVWALSRWNLKEQKSFNILYLTPLEGKKKEDFKKIQLTHGEDTFHSIQWVPGENKISFKTSREFKDTKPGNLWVMDLNGGEPHPVTSFETGVQQYQWLDKDNLLFMGSETKSLYDKEKEEKKDTSEVMEDEDHQEIPRLFKYDLNTKKTKRLTANSKPLQFFLLSHHKQWVIYSISMSIRFVVDQQVPPKYYLMNLTSGETKEILADPSLKPINFDWALDDTGLYISTFYSTDPKYTFAGVIKAYWYSLDTGKYQEVDLQWERYGGSLFPTPDGFISALPDGVYLKYARYIKKGDSWKQQWIKNDLQKNIANLRLAEDGKTMIYEYSTSSRPPRYYLAELKGDRFTREIEVMDIESPWFKKPLARSEIITWKGAKGETIEGVLYYPYNYEAGQKYPLILMIHGGPFGADMDFFSDGWGRPAHLLAERGAFILKVNYHGSSNYGLEFAESIVGRYYEYEIEDIEKGVDQLIKEGKVDGEKLGVSGWSNGSILGTRLIIHTQRYKAASLGAGDVNWTSDYGNCMFGVAFDNYYFGGPPWEKVGHYIEKSPLFQLKKVTTPTLIFHGTKDQNVPYEQGMQYYRALQQMGNAPVRFISFPDEPHGPRKLAHQRRKVEEEIQWFEKYLFKTHKEKNEALKKNSPLERLDTYLKIAKVNGKYGLDQVGILIPEVVEYEKLMIGRFEVTRAQWAAFDKNYPLEIGTENYPVTGITFEQAEKYIQWLNQTTGAWYRLPGKAEVKTLYSKPSGNTLDYWAGYTLNPDDSQELLKELDKYGDKPVLLKPVGSFEAEGEEPVFDLGGNAAEWVQMEAGHGQPCGGSAQRPADDKTDLLPQSPYIGFRVVKEKK